ncbi:hypothetical protein JCM10908_003715 [Rhodotorula pacifica]|uniref:uncharacterized protein n=1 Tax=Rhodotorula pacifica TaxID=1495444 RepID=UPI0031712899
MTGAEIGRFFAWDDVIHPQFVPFDGAGRFLGGDDDADFDGDDEDYDDDDDYYDYHQPRFLLAHPYAIVYGGGGGPGGGGNRLGRAGANQRRVNHARLAAAAEKRQKQQQQRLDEKKKAKHKKGAFVVDGKDKIKTMQHKKQGSVIDLSRDDDASSSKNNSQVQSLAHELANAVMDARAAVDAELQELLRDLFDQAQVG